MLKNSWVGSWAGGRVQDGARGRTYWIEKRHGGKRYAVRLVGVSSEREAVEELRVWRANPDGYQPPAVRREIEAAEKSEREAAAEAGAVYVTPELIGRFTQALLGGYDARGGRTPRHVATVHRCLSAWQTSPALHGRDLRTVTLRDLQRQLDSWDGRRARIAALKALTRWMRARGELRRSDDPTVDLACEQARKPTPLEREGKVYDVETLERTYAAIPNQTVRDVFAVRLATGLHESEIRRIAEGECVIRRVTGHGRIAGTVDVLHKSRAPHRVSVDADTLARLERLQATYATGKAGTERFPTEKTLKLNRERAHAAVNANRTPGTPESPPVYVGNLRATRTTLLEEIGETVRPMNATAGVPLHEVARSHGHDPRTAERFYSGRQIPPMHVLALNLTHPNDPPTVATLDDTPAA